jgi:hypothetical protein
MRNTRVLLALFVVSLFAAPTLASNSTARIAAVVVPAATAVRIDGELTEEVWNRAPVVSGFKQRDPRDGEPATFDSEVRVAYDDDALYIAVNAADPEPARLVGLRTRRDEGSPSDWIRVAIDSFHDRRSAYEFAVNPAGVKQDGYWFNDGNKDTGWDAVWEVAVSRSDRGWRAEFRIPFSQLRFHPAENATFGFSVVRQIGRLSETSSWPLLSKNASGYVSSFGELTGLRLTRSAKRLELVPYVVGDLKTEPSLGANPLIKGRDPNASLGVDMKYAIRPGVTLTATVNPDFGQVEADPAVVNLSAFETFFAERRPFFVEGSGVFRFDTDCNDGQCSGLFYSRRIGRSPRGSVDAPDGTYSTQPVQTTILGAAKLTGRAGGFSVGALSALTSDEDAVIASGANRARQTVEPLTGYTVIRASREFANQSSLGFMGTTTNRRLDDPTRFLPSNALTSGIDWDWRLTPGYSITGYTAGSTVRGDAEAIAGLQQSNVHSFQRPDAGHVELDPTRTSLNGYGGGLAFNKISGERVRFSTNVGVRSPGFDINDVGFLRRADQRTMSNWFQWRYDRPTKLTRSFRWNLNQWAGWNYDGDRLYSGGNFNSHAVFTSNWSSGFGLNLDSQGFDDRATRGGPGAYRSSGRSFWGYINSDSRKRVSMYLNTFFGRQAEGHGGTDFSPGLTFRPTTFMTLSTGVSLNANHDRQQWIGEEDGHYVFGRIDQKTVSLTARVNYTVTPRLTVQLYAAPFVSAGRYSEFKELADGRAKDFSARFTPYAYDGRPDFNYRSFRTTNVVRWEYKPGSTLFVVWQQGREGVLDRGNFDFRSDFGGVFDAPARNVFLIKWAYWLNY